ncbi:MAG: ABC transporter permease [Phycisphaerae bacterium]
MELFNVLILARKELRDALKNRWFLLYTLCFSGLTLLLAKVSMTGIRNTGAVSFGRTTAGMVNLILLFVPLMGLTTGAASIAGERERGTLACLLAQPVHRLEVLLGKFLGLWAAITLVLALGFGITALSAMHGSIGPLARLLAFTDLLAAAMLSVGLLISTISRRVSVATGTALFFWLALVFLTDLGLMGSVLMFRLRVQNLFYLTIANPMQAFKMAVLGSIHTSLDVLGPAGLFATQTYGSALPWLFVATLLAWICLPIGAAWAIFSWKGEA